MKKAALITIHVGSNFGSVLQTIASSKIISDFGYDVTIIDYRPDRVTLKRYIKDSFKSFRSLISRFLNLPVWLKNRNIYTTYLRKYCKLSEPIFLKDNFRKKCPKADIYITGSDQVWNSIHNEGFDTHYLYEGIEGEKIALSSSIGREDLSDEELIEMGRFLQTYSAISVREESARHLLSHRDIESTLLIDPTFMLDKIEWKTYMSKRIIDDNYLLLYLPYNIKDKNIIFTSARNIAKAKNLKIITFSWDNRNEPLADKTIKFANPGDFMSLFEYADFIITNSFHGTAFSINFNKQFVVYMPTKFTTRIKSILELTGLTNVIKDKILESQDIISIDYKQANQILHLERNKVLDFLSSNL